MTEVNYAKGLEGVIAAESEICQIDGANGKLYYRGYPIEELARSSSFEETTYLLLYEKLPSKQELADFSRRMRQSRALHPSIQRMIRDFPPAGSPMELLQSVISYLSGSVEHHKVMGMGHRVYKAKDPRAVVMEEMLKELCEQKGDSRGYEFLKKLEEGFRVRMEDKGKLIYPNVDFFSGAVYTMLGIPRYLFTPIFAAARSAGWLAHILEQRKDNRLFRPKALFVGPAPRPYVPIDKRK